ncbi:recombinase family protein [Geomonas propionica]|uniref:Recombinase family protein n=1 Tax=Geomonas propionica TaxID=2798582 RepID=A0ABS0YP80_9BACT|nr:recombinase family protein [Geomonas propionica]MBJ6799720.1 recombinase family protein [Geomonas propionica]
MPKAYSYMRFSTPDQAKGDSKRRQSQQAEEYAATHGLELDDKLTYSDFGVSAFRGANVEIGKLGQFMEAIRRKEVESGSYLLVESLDRISRDVILPAQNIFTQIILEGVTIVTLADRRVYSAESVNKSPFLLIEAIVILIRANEESEMKSKRLKSMWENKRNNASTQTLTTVGPGWLKYNKKTQQFEAIPERAAIVNRIYNEYLSGKGYLTIARMLREDKVRTWTFKKGEKSIWREHYVSRILGNAAVIGTLTPHVMGHGNGKSQRVPLEGIKNYYPPVISEELYEKVQARRRQYKTRYCNSAALKNIFSMVGRCPQCNGRMMYLKKGPRWDYIICTNAQYQQGCTTNNIPYGRLETVFVSEFANAILEFPFINPVINKTRLSVSHLKEKLRRATVRQNKLLNSLKNGLELESYQSTMSLNMDLQALETTIDNCHKELVRLNSLHSDQALKQMKAYIHDFTEHISVDYINREVINKLLRSMCDTIIISHNLINVKFKMGPSLSIEYDKYVSGYEYISDTSISI